jgi:N-sulfoglucosamine sulfohydrolase
MLAHQLEYPGAEDVWGSPSWQGILKRGDKLMGKREVKAFLNRPREELYDLEKDPDELRNLAGDPDRARVLDDLRAKLSDWRKKTADPWLVKDRHE